MVFKDIFQYSKIHRKTTVIAVVLVLISIFIFYRNISQNKREKFVLEKVSRGEVLKEVSETGTVKASEEINLGFKTSGKIEKIYVRTGERVKVGQNLAKLDTADLAIKLEKARASLKVIEAKRGNALVNLENYRQSLKDIEAEAKKDLETAYEDGLNDLDDSYLKIFNSYTSVDLIYRTYFTVSDQDAIRIRDNKDIIKKAADDSKTDIDLAKKSGKQEDIDKALSNMQTNLSKTRVALAEIRDITENLIYRNKISSADKTSLDNHRSYINTAYTNIIDSQQNISSTKIANEKNINDALAKIKEAENQLEESSDGLYLSQIEEAKKDIELLENQISDAFLTSPIEGKITDIDKEIGETVQAQEKVITILSALPFQLKADIYEGDIVGIEAGNPVKINLVAFPDQTLTGKVVSIDPAEKLIDDIVYYEITIAFDFIKEGLRNGMTADILVEKARKENVLRVLKRAVEKNNGEKIVEVYKNGKTEKRKITIGLEGNDYIEVLDGLREGEEVVAGKKI